MRAVPLRVPNTKSRLPHRQGFRGGGDSIDDKLPVVRMDSLNDPRSIPSQFNRLNTVDLYNFWAGEGHADRAVGTKQVLADDSRSGFNDARETIRFRERGFVQFVNFLDISIGPEPFDDIAVVVEHRNGSDIKPAIEPVET